MKVRRVDFYPDEYITGVAGVLNAVEQGVYWMICSLIMSHGGPVKYDEKRFGGLLRMRPAEVRKVIEGLVAAGKLAFDSDGSLTQKRAVAEVEKSAKRILSASENGTKGGRPATRRGAQNVDETSTKRGRSVDETSMNLSSNASEVSMNLLPSSDISQRNQQNEKAEGFRSDKTNQQPATSNQQPVEREDTAAAQSLDSARPNDPVRTPEARAVCDAAGMDVSKSPGWASVDAEVAGWIAEGCDLERDILPAVRARTAKMRHDRRAPPGSPTYFRGAVADARASRLAASPSGRTLLTAVSEPGSAFRGLDPGAARAAVDRMFPDDPTVL
jgi:hypothetical protein